MKVGDLVAELKREAVEKEFQAHHGALTALPNRVMVGDQLGTLLHFVSSVSGWPCSSWTSTILRM